MRLRSAASAVAVVLLASCSPVPGTDAPAADGAAAVPAGLDNLNAVLWTQTAVEYQATSLQAYGLARRVLDEALADATWTAALEQTGDFTDLPSAVVLDIDETVLSNYAFEARLTVDEQAFSSELWDAWVQEVAAPAIPGALDFVNHAQSRGVTVFFITNRLSHLETATRDNLRDEGFSVPASPDTLLMRGERPGWESSNKTPRRAFVAQNYRILLQLGDNMGDFVGAADGTVVERRAFAEQHRDAWGSRWITLANPTYGSWLSVVLGDAASAPPAEQDRVKKAALDPQR